jgi:hypothetical protein
MATFKNIAWYFAIGFAGNQLLSFLGVNAVPKASCERYYSSLKLAVRHTSSENAGIHERR